MSTVADINAAMEKPGVAGQAQLLQALPSHWKSSPEDLAWAKRAESSFDFWDKPEDAIYDQP